jgi:ribosomal-protein-alanine N-acetyltransferase
MLTRCTLRRATPEDFPALWRLETAAHSHPWAEDVLRSLLGGSAIRFWLLEDPGHEAQAFAVVQVAADEASLLNLVTAPAQQGKGIGRYMLNHVIEVLAQEAAVQSIFLEVRISNARAMRLYDSCGFVEIGVRRDYYPLANGKREDAVMMAFPLRLGFS